MNTIHETRFFAEWLRHLPDRKGQARVLDRIRSARAGNFGDSKSLGDGVSEMRIHFGPGYRVYYAQEGRQVYLLLIGGDKSGQKRDIRNAKELWKEIQKGEI
ncbi:MAG: type II toxin-antitoxin system RelE/ParE family toxin [Planctomycetaceae bacterium]|nr:type II toxin-antitoxin system RelE/ParE family toxin [Planctomycetaceae bacterium]